MTRPGSACRAVSLVSALLLAFIVVPAFAELGGTQQTVSNDQAQFKATRQITRTSTHAVHEMQTAAGGRVREYVSNSGTVFGVTWDGPSKPDLKQLLGQYYDQYLQSERSARRRRGPVSLHSSSLVVESAGHMRAFTGRAYVPELLPEGVTTNDIQ